MKFRIPLLTLVVFLLGLLPFATHAQTTPPVTNSTYVSCSYATLTGSTVSSDAAYIQVHVSLASDLTKNIGSAFEPTIAGNYSISVDYPTQPADTRLILTIFEWDAQGNRMGVGRTAGYDCVDATSAPYPDSPTASITNLYTDCTFVDILGRIGTQAPQVKVNVYKQGDLLNLLASDVASVYYNGFYTNFDIPPQPAGTTLIITAGEWDGQGYLAPAVTGTVPCYN